MLVFFFTLLTLAYVYHQDNRVGIASAIYIFIVLIIHALFYYEVMLFDLDYFISDELAYIDFDDAQGLSESAKSDRILWFYYHRLVAFIMPADGLFNKLISLPFLPLLLLLVYNICNKRNLSLFLFLLCPYLLFLMQTALRDIVILYFTLLIVSYWCNAPSKNLKVIFQLITFTFLLFMLRPFAVFIIAFSIYVYELFTRFANKPFRDVFYLLFYNAVVAILISGIFYILFQDRIDQYIRTLTYLNENGLWLDESKSNVKPALTFQYFSYAIIRYISTPLPTSLLERFLTESVTQFGYLDDIVRLLNQLFYFAMLIWIVFKLVIKKCKLVAQWSSTIWVLCIVTILNSIVYALYYAGGGHSRIKLLLFVFVFIVFVCLERRDNEVN